MAIWRKISFDSKKGVEQLRLPKFIRKEWFEIIYLAALRKCYAFIANIDEKQVKIRIYQEGIGKGRD